MTSQNSIAVPCCHQSLHVVCLARSFSSCGLQCPLCNQWLAEFARSSSSTASTLFRGCVIDVHRPPSNRGLGSLVVPSGFPPRSESPVLLCCTRLGPPPEFEPSMDRRMGWSPSQPLNSSERAARWLCVGCNRTADPSHIPQSVPPPGLQCATPSTTVVDCVNSKHWFWCVRCQCRTGNVQSEATPQVPCASVALPVSPRDWFIQGPLSQRGHLYGWGDSPITAPGSGTRSWLLCPLISLALASAERARNVTLYSTGPRQLVPLPQERF